MKKLLFYLFLLLTIGSCTNISKQEVVLTSDGTWCWFSDPRAICFTDAGGATKILTGWVKADGSIEACLVNNSSLESHSVILFPEFEADDHNNPAFARFGNGEIFTVYAWHGHQTGIIVQFVENARKPLQFTDPDTLIPTTPLLKKEYPNISFTYGNPMILEDENERLYCFGRWTGYKPNVIYSDDRGKSWSDPKIVVCPLPFDAGNRPYVKYYSDGKSKIHMTFTDGHPRNEELNSVYYACYENGSWYRADGSKICDFNQLPFTPEDASVVYRAEKEKGRAWVWDITADPNGNPVIAYARYPDENDHRYHYARFMKGKWDDFELCRAGGWFPHTKPGEKEGEPHYSGGICINPSKPEVVYLSRETDSVFSIERWETRDMGKNWDIERMSDDNGKDHVRPVSVRNCGIEKEEIVLWLQLEKYIHYTDFSSSVIIQKREQK